MILALLYKHLSAEWVLFFLSLPVVFLLSLVEAEIKFKFGLEYPALNTWIHTFASMPVDFYWSQALGSQFYVSFKKMAPLTTQLFTELGWGKRYRTDFRLTDLCTF